MVFLQAIGYEKRSRVVHAGESRLLQCLVMFEGCFDILNTSELVAALPPQLPRSVI